MLDRQRPPAKTTFRSTARALLPALWVRCPRRSRGPKCRRSGKPSERPLPFRWRHQALDIRPQPRQRPAPLVQKVGTSGQCSGHRLRYRRLDRVQRGSPTRNLRSSRLANPDRLNCNIGFRQFSSCYCIVLYRGDRLEVIFEAYLFPIAGPRPFKVRTIVARFDGGIDANLSRDSKRVTIFKGCRGGIIRRPPRTRHDEYVVSGIAARGDYVIDCGGILDVRVWT